MLYSVLYVSQYVRGFKFTILAQRFQATRFAEFFSTIASCLGDPIGIHTQYISGFQMKRGHGTLPI